MFRHATSSTSIPKGTRRPMQERTSKKRLGSLSPVALSAEPWRTSWRNADSGSFPLRCAEKRTTRTSLRFRFPSPPRTSAGSNAAYNIPPLESPWMYFSEGCFRLWPSGRVSSSVCQGGLKTSSDHSCLQRCGRGHHSWPDENCRDVEGKVLSVIGRM